MGELSSLIREEVQNIRNMGTRSMQEIEQILAQFGFSFKDEIIQTNSKEDTEPKIETTVVQVDMKDDREKTTKKGESKSDEAEASFEDEMIQIEKKSENKSELQVTREKKHALQEKISELEEQLRQAKEL